MKAGYNPDLSGLPNLPITTSTNVTSTSYAYSAAYPVGTFVQGFMCIKATLGAGVTSVELKIEQALSSSSSDDWFGGVLCDVANKTTVGSEFLVPTKDYVFSITANTGTDAKIGPIPIALFMPFCRLAYKITGVGTANIGVTIGRVSLGG